MGFKTDDDLLEVVPPSQIKFGGLSKKEYEKLPLEKDAVFEETETEEGGKLRQRTYKTPDGGVVREKAHQLEKQYDEAGQKGQAKFYQTYKSYVGQSEPKELSTFFREEDASRELLPVKELTEFNKEFVDL